MPGVVTATARLLSHKPGQRATIEYGGFVVKVYARRRLAERVRRWTEVLRADVGSVPAVLAVAEDLGLVVYERAPGDDLRHALAAGDAERPLALAARWLVRLHRASPPAGLKHKPLEHELAKAEAWCARLRLQPDRLRELAADVPAATPVLLHRDFYYAHVLWDGRRITILDFDQLALGDPALDVGHFVAHLENLALRSGSPRAYDEAAGRFVSWYLATGGQDVRAALPFYRAHTLAKLAATEVERRRPGWRERARRLCALVESEERREWT